MATDPVCGMFVDERTAHLTFLRENRTYYFCAASCREEFGRPAAHLLTLRRELLIAWPLAVLAFLATYLPWGGSAAWVAGGAATVVQFYVGRSFYRGAWDALRGRIGNMDLLIAVGTTAAYAYSVAVLALPGRLPGTTYFDASALILVLILSGNYLESRTRAYSSSALRKLAELVPTTARRIEPGGVHEVPVAELRVGERIAVEPAGRFPVDGIVRTGSTSVDESILTGESRPIVKEPGSPVLAGARNGEGRVEVEVTGVASDTFLARIGELVNDAELSRVPLQALADRIAAVFAPVVLVAAIVSAGGWYWFGGASLSVAVLVFVSVAITACPCAFGIATPAAIIAGTGRAAEEGILFKGHDAVEQAARVDLVLFDKTGTLTAGHPTVSDVTLVPTAGPGSLAWAASVEVGSDHPLGPAIVAEARRRGLALPSATQVRAVPGRGVAGQVEGHRVEVGSWLPESPDSTLPEPLAGAATALDRLGQTWSVVKIDGALVALIGFADRLRPEAEAAVRSLRRRGIEVGLVTGDRPDAAAPIAASLGITLVRARVSPEGKVQTVREFRSQGRHVAFVGDGVNDAPALAVASLGIALGTGTDVAKETGRVLLVRADLRLVPAALGLAQATVAKVRQNLLWALGYNAVLLPIAAGLLVPFFGFRVFEVLPITGAIAMALSSTSVVLNSLSLRRFPLARAGARPG